MSRSLVRKPATEPIEPTVPMSVVSGQMYRQNVRRSKTRKKTRADETMPTTIQLVSAGLPGLWRDYWLATGERQGHPVRIGAVTDQPDAFLTAIANGYGVALVPESAARYYARPGITYRPVTGVSPSQVGVAWPPANDRNPVVQDFVDCCLGNKPPQHLKNQHDQNYQPNSSPADHNDLPGKSQQPAILPDETEPRPPICTGSRTPPKPGDWSRRRSAGASRNPVDRVSGNAARGPLFCAVQGSPERRSARAPSVADSVPPPEALGAILG
jgi:hypothetical protein